MRNKSTYFILIVIVALAAFFATRQRTLNALRADNDLLAQSRLLWKSRHAGGCPRTSGGIPRRD